MARKRDPLTIQTDTLVTNLVKMAISQSNSHRAGEADAVTLPPEDRMTIAEMRTVAETSMRWLKLREELTPVEEEKPEWQRLMSDFNSGTPRGRRNGSSGGEPAPATVGPVDAESVDGSH